MIRCSVIGACALVFALACGGDRHDDNDGGTSDGGASDGGGDGGSNGKQLSVTVLGSGSVGSTPSGISCPPMCTDMFAAGTLVTLHATAPAGSRFAGWTASPSAAGCGASGDCVLTLSQEINVTARFDAIPSVIVAPTVVEIAIPQNCAATFQITNSGAAGSQLAFTTADDGSLGGFLDVTPSSGTIPGGQSATVSVSVKPQFVSTQPTLAGDDLLVDVYTPGASNLVKVPVSIRVRDASVLVGSWSGTWSGFSEGHPPNGGGPDPTAAVSGTWQLSLDSVDIDGGSTSGSLTWDGNDAYWTYDSQGAGTPQPFVADRTIALQSANAVTTVAAAGCPARFTLGIDGFANAPNPSDAFYGPRFEVDLHTDGTLVSQGQAWSAHPYAPGSFDTAISGGAVQGGKH